MGDDLLENRFDIWWEENCMNVSCDRSEAFDIYSLGVKYAQQKLDEYILVAETLDDLCVREVAKNAELKKQIDIMQGKINEVIRYIGNDFDDFYLGETNSDIHKILTVDLEQALKGE